MGLVASREIPGISASAAGPPIQLSERYAVAEPVAILTKRRSEPNAIGWSETLIRASSHSRDGV
jgi:hypothetical protein